jgi:tRNA(Ile)-lysidine synthase
VLQKLKSFISEHQLLEKTDQVALAISGGKDSVFAAYLLSALKMPFIMVHLNFSLRAEESDEDELFVAALAANLPYCTALFSKKVDTMAYAQKNKLNTQLSARELRYTYFHELQEQGLYTRLITAHHSNDQVETFFINLNRSAGLVGLAAIPLKRDYIIRPFLSFTSEEILGYLTEHSITYREDSSNSSEKYLRNSIRHSVLPHIEDKLPGFKTQVQKSISNLGSENTILQHFVSDFEQQHFISSSGTIIASKSALLSFPHLGVLLYRILDKYRFNPSVCEQIAQSLEAEGGRIFESSTHILSTDTKNIQIRRKKVSLPESIAIPGPGIYSLGDNTLSIQKASKIVFSDNPNKEIVSIDESYFPLKLRFWKTGDKIQPLGMTGNKLLSDFFTDQKINVLKKREIPLLCKQDEVLWVVGYRISEKIKIQKDKALHSLLFTFEE